MSNPRGRAARAMHGEKLRKFTETRANAPRARYAAIWRRSYCSRLMYKFKKKYTYKQVLYGDSHIER
jgi:hypothetical protein